MANVVPLFELKSAAPKPAGRVLLVGAGPGDPELLTRKAYAAITTADVVFYDDLVSTAILDEIPATVEKIYVGKPHGGANVSQSEIIDRLIEAAFLGRNVVRLKGGDPMIFGRGGEEIEGLNIAGIAVEVIPGITAALGAAGSTHIPLTHRSHAAQVSFITAVRRDGSLAEVRGLAGPGKTLVVYMGVTQAEKLAEALRADGVSGDLPLAIVENATRPEERHFIATVDSLADTVAREAIRSPALFIVGSVATAASVLAPNTTTDTGAFHWAHFAHG